MCGNHVCEVGETTASCASDCTSATCTVGDPTSCSGNNICIANNCQNAFGRTYRIKIVSAVFPATDANGDSWDAFGGLPDGKATVTVNGVAYTTPSVDDTLTPTWNFLTPAVLIPSATNLTLSVVDADVTFDDPAWSCTNNPLGADLIRAGARCAGTGALASGYVDFTFVPQ